MKVIAFNGSPRKGGNTNLMIETALKPLAAAGVETEVVQIGGTGIKPCTACGMCYKNKDRKCIIKDDIFNDLLEKTWAADGIIIGSPTYFAALTPETKAFIDRLGYVSRANGGLLRRKPAASVAVMRRAGGIEVLNSIDKLFMISEMIAVGSTYWNVAFGLQKGDAANDEEGVQTMTNLGNNMLWLLQKING
ncbi:multimeric flavodoxin WrbA [Elusimicrobium simillimum]|uniref:flavodoxin family protein n=1 Tax=Elusimicrobium simillimum TaxID=3143438 RepID=UPI003C6F9FF6